MCTSGAWFSCPLPAEPGCQIGDEPACNPCFEEHCSNACDTDPLVEET